MGSRAVDAYEDGIIDRSPLRCRSFAIKALVVKRVSSFYTIENLS
jgi:hypothetical protein